MDLWYLNGARYYDPTLRRFITPDTIVQDYYNPQDLNRYSYAWNNPLRITDPTGHYENSQTTTKDQFYNKLYLWTQNPYFYTAADAAQGVLDMPSIMLVTVGQGYEAAKGLVFGNRFAEALIGNYDSKAVDAFFFMSGAPLVQAVSNAATYSKAALGAKLGETATGDGFLANEIGALKLGNNKAIVIGEGMGDVKTAARQLREQGIDAKWYQAWSKNFPIDRRLTTSELDAAKLRNARWIESKINQGYDIYDLGINPKSMNPGSSPFYQLEVDLIKQYNYPTIDIKYMRR